MGSSHLSPLKYPEIIKRI